MDEKDLAKLTHSLAKFTAGGPSGWTAELVVPLLTDQVCLKGLALLCQLIANNELDEHSRLLLTSCTACHPKGQ